MRLAGRKQRFSGVPVMPRAEFDYLPLGGGFDQETPIWEVPPGRVRQTKNYEIGINNGYVDIRGYERYDGQDRPSEQTYAILDVTITGTFAAGNTISGVSSGHTAEVLEVVTTATPNYLVITKQTGTFTLGEDINVSAVKQGEVLDTAAVDGAETTEQDAQYTNLAADEYRADIAAVPGSGSILGVVQLNDVVYAWRDNAGQTAAEMYKSSASGWTAVPLGRELPFTSGGTYVPQEGDTITGAISGATAVLTRVMLESGSWTGGDAAGRYIFASQTGTFQAENLDVGANLNISTIAADSSAISMSPGGRFEFELHNFGGADGGERRVYGCDGANRGFEFDGSVFCPIDTGMATDTPTHVVIHRNHLFFAFGASAQHSGLGFPYIWQPIFGAAELATGDTITGFQTEPGAEGDATLAVFNRNRIHILYGTDSDTWNLVEYREEVGAFPHTIQQLGFTMYMDDRGITDLRTVQQYGNFQHTTLSSDIQTFINSNRTKAVASCIVREKNQYRLFYNDSKALYMTMSGNKVLGIMPIQFDDPVLCVWSAENAAGDEEIYFGSDNGFVYQMDKGTSFDGEPIDAFFVTHYHFGRSLGWIKKYLDGVFEARGEGYAQFDFTFELGYNSTRIPQPETETNELAFSVARWDSFTWDQFFWDGEQLGPSNVKMSGMAENVSIVVRKNSDYFEPILFSGLRIRQHVTRMLRG